MELVKLLAEMKSYIESMMDSIKEEITQREESLIKHQQFLDYIDKMLAEKSFKTADIVREDTPEPIGKEMITITPKDNPQLVLGIMKIHENNITVTPSTNIRYAVNAAPFVDFLQRKVLDSMKAEDNEKIEQGRLKKQDAFDYEITSEKGNLKKIEIKNFRTEREIWSIRGAIRWTFEQLMRK